MIAKYRSHRRADRDLRRSESGPLRVGGVGEQQLDATCSLGDLTDQREVGLAAVDRREVELEVTAVQNGARRRVVGGGECVGYRVRDGDELAVERPDRTPFAVVHRDQFGAAENAGLLDPI